jgi:hypothetical protein
MCLFIDIFIHLFIWVFVLVQLFPVAEGSAEWNLCRSKLSVGANPRFLTIQRVQNPALWQAYATYAETKSRAGIAVADEYFWHGTRGNHPREIYTERGFDKGRANVGGCIWFARQSTYSMGGYQHPIGNNRFLIFLALVAMGDAAEVKTVRPDILNVFVNAATYPAYLIEYSPS